MSFRKVADASQVPLGMVRVARVENDEVALCNLDGTVYALANVCTHDGGPLGEGCLVEGHVECPRHGARFDVRTGAACALPAVAGIRIFAVRVEAGEILVDLDQEPQ